MVPKYIEENPFIVDHPGHLYKREHTNMPVSFKEEIAKLENSKINIIFLKNQDTLGHQKILQTLPPDFSGVVNIDNWTLLFMKNGKKHRENDLPASITKRHHCDDLLEIKWYNNGILERFNDLPAEVTIFSEDHIQYNWCKGGEPHRENDNPAIIKADGEKHWYKEGQLHRDTDLPAIERMTKDGHYDRKEWWRNGERHRGNGLPAIMEFRKKTNEWIGTSWYVENELHREGDLPAIIWNTGTRFWLQNNELHRENGPAEIQPHGVKTWWHKGKCHRVDGPAVENTLSKISEWFFKVKNIGLMDLLLSIILMDLNIGTFMVLN